MAKLVLMSLGLVVLLHLAAVGQVDTLDLVKIDSLSLPAGNSSIYISNIDNDSTEEIIVRSQINIYVYNYPSLNSIWISPSSNWADKVVFYDWNHDGHQDIAISDTSVKVYDISTNQLLWTSPRIDAYTAYSFDFGDLNEDGFDDAVIVRQGSTIAHDSFYVDIYHGPNMELSGHYGFIPANIAGGEALSVAMVTRLSGDSGMTAKVVLFSTVRNFFTTYYQDLYCIFDGNWGKIYLINPSNFNTVMVDTTGYSLYKSCSTDESLNTYLYTITRRNTDQWGTLCHQFWYRQVGLWRISADAVINTEILFYNSMAGLDREWRYFVIGELNYNHLGQEICYGLYDTLWLYTYPDFTPIWRDTLSMGNFNINGVYHNNALFSYPVILVWPYAINGSNGVIAAMLSRPLPTWTAIKDLDHDGEDELLLGGMFYHLQHAVTGIGPDNSLPSSFLVFPNYPNPFNAQTTIKYFLPKSADVSIDIFDILGRKIETLVSDRQTAGEHSIVWNAKDATSGVYFYRIKAGEYSETKRCLLLK